jgi:hypothetical protein
MAFYYWRPLAISNKRKGEQAMSELKQCWEIKNCGRSNGGPKVAEFGECIASKEGLGHSCWAIAGTLCGGKVQGTTAQKENNCMQCDVYKLYHRTVGSAGKLVATAFPAEQQKFNALLMSRMKK